MSRKVLLSTKPITLSSSGTPPSELRIWAYGDVDTLKGTFQLTSESASQIMQAANDWGNRYSFDYNHSVPLGGLTPEEGIAAGWFDLELRSDGLWAANIEWTPRATEYLNNREYRYWSPWFFTDDKDNITALGNIALTNVPATKDLQPLMASLLNQTDNNAPAYDIGTRIAVAGSPHMPDQAAGEIREAVLTWVYGVAFDSMPDMIHHWYVESEIQAEDATVEQVAVARKKKKPHMPGMKMHQTANAADPIPGGKTMKTVLAALKLTDTSTEAEALERITGITASNQQLLGATGKTDVNEAVGVILGWKASADQNVILAGKLEKLEADRKSERLTSLIASGKADGKITPALEPVMLTWDVATLENFLAVAPKVIPVGEASAEPTHQSADGQGVLLTYKGKAWADMKPIEKADLHQTDNTMYTAMRDQARAN